MDPARSQQAYTNVVEPRFHGDSASLQLSLQTVRKRLAGVGSKTNAYSMQQPPHHRQDALTTTGCSVLLTRNIHPRVRSPPNRRACTLRRLKNVASQPALDLKHPTFRSTIASGKVASNQQVTGREMNFHGVAGTIGMGADRHPEVVLSLWTSRLGFIILYVKL